MKRFDGDFENLEAGFIDNYILEYLGLDKERVKQDFGTTFNFVNSFLHNKIHNVDLDLYGENAQPFHNVINGVNQLIDAGLEGTVLTARNSKELDRFVEDKEKDGIVAKTNRFVDRYLPKANQVRIVDRTKHKKPFVKNAQIWIDDDYDELFEELNKKRVYIVKNLFPRNKHLPAHSIIRNRDSEEQSFVREVLEYAEKTGATKFITDLDDTLVRFRGCFKEVCDYALSEYPTKFKKYEIGWHSEKINTKKKSYELWRKGFFGNRLRIWDSLEELLEDTYNGTVSMRYKGSAGGGFCSYEVPISKIPEIQEEWVKQGANINSITFNESAPDHKLLMQGEVMLDDTTPYELFYSTDRKKMRDALKNGKRAKDLTAKLILEHFLNPSSFSDMQELFERYPNHVIEFSTYSTNLGNIPGRNTIIWEVRNY